MLSWLKRYRRCKLAHAFLRDCSYKGLKLAHFLGQWASFSLCSQLDDSWSILGGDGETYGRLQASQRTPSRSARATNVRLAARVRRIISRSGASDTGLAGAEATCTGRKRF